MASKCFKPNQESYLTPSIYMKRERERERERVKEMLGRVRPSSSSLERPPSKIIKDDSLSIYEATLVKLRHGSQRDPISPSEQAMKIDVSCDFASNIPYDEAMTEDTNCSSTSILSSSSDCRHMGTSKELQNKTMSVIYLFARYKSSQHAQSFPDEAVTVENNCCSASSSPSAGTVR